MTGGSCDPSRETLHARLYRACDLLFFLPPGAILIPDANTILATTDATPMLLNTIGVYVISCRMQIFLPQRKKLNHNHSHYTGKYVSCNSATFNVVIRSLKWVRLTRWRNIWLFFKNIVNLCFTRRHFWDCLWSIKFYFEIEFL